MIGTWHGYPQHPGSHPDRPWWRVERGGLGWRRTDGVIAYPLQAPPPLCGQVWANLATGGQSMITEVAPRGAGRWTMTAGRAKCDIGEGTDLPWPPHRCALVAGPLSPWMDTGAKDGGA